MISSTTRFVYAGLSLFLGLALAGLFGCGFRHARAGADSPNATFFVTNTDDSGLGSLRAAIQDANLSPGSDLISISAAGTLHLISPLPVITDTLTLQGPGVDLFLVDGQDLYRVFEISGADATISDLTVQHGMVTGTLEYGAGIRSTGILSLNRVNVLDNTAESHGGGLYAAGSLSITEGIIQNNRSTTGVGGGLRSLGSTIISNTQIISNTSRGDGGGAYALDDLFLINALFLDNLCTATSCDGGGLFSFSHTDIYNTQFINNTAQDQAGGAASPGALTITGGLFQNNQAVYGTGGGLYAQNMAGILDTQFLSNTARSFGGGMYAFASVDLTGAVFQNNQSIIGTGGGLYAGGSVNLNHTRFIRNTAIEGGGITHALGSASLVNSLFAENSATNSTGMAMLLASAGPVEILHVTIAGTAAANGSAIEAIAGSAVITNTIITSHMVGINNTGASLQQDFNLFFNNGADTQGSISGGANSLNGDPLFVNSKADDYHISTGSAAIDVGTDAGIAIDYDGDFRPLGLGIDIGFDEMNQSPGLDTSVLYLPLIQN